MKYHLKRRADGQWTVWAKYGTDHQAQIATERVEFNAEDPSTFMASVAEAKHRLDVNIAEARAGTSKRKTEANS